MVEKIFNFIMIVIFSFLFGSMIYLGLDLDTKFSILHIILLGCPFGILYELGNEILGKLNNKDNK